MADILNVEKRDTRGTRLARRMRREGRIPAVLYGHGDDTVSLAVVADEIAAAIRHGSRLVDLKGGVKQSALIREIQWDTFGNDILHIDFTRVSKGEKVEINVVVELRGEAPGTKAGGVVEHLLHQVQLECPVTSIPEKLVLNVNSLQLGESINVTDLELPTGAKLLVPDDTAVVQCVEPAEVPDEDAVPGQDTAEPEIIGKKAEDEEGGESK